MQVVVSGKQVDLGDALRHHVTERINAGVGKYFGNAIEAQVIFSKQAHVWRAECSVHVGSGIAVHSEGEGVDAYTSFDSAADRIEKQLRRDKRRRRNHHSVRKPDVSAGEA